MKTIRFVTIHHTHEEVSFFFASSAVVANLEIGEPKNTANLEIGEPKITANLEIGEPYPPSPHLATSLSGYLALYSIAKALREHYGLH